MYAQNFLFYFYICLLRLYLSEESKVVLTGMNARVMFNITFVLAYLIYCNEGYTVVRKSLWTHYSYRT